MTKFKVVIPTSISVIELVGDIKEINDKEITLELDNSSILINRDFVAFIQTVEDKPTVVKNNPQPNTMPQKSKPTMAAEFVKSRLRHDPIEQMIPMSQLPDNEEELIMPNDEEDLEVIRQIERANGLEPQERSSNNLADAIKHRMNPNEDFSVSFGGAQYANPFKTLVGNKKK